MKTVKLLSSIAGSAFSFAEGDVLTMSDKAAAGYIKAGIAKGHKPEPAEKVLFHPSAITVDTDLSPDCPAYDILIEAGLGTIEAVKGHEDLTMLKGIGPATQTEILEFVNQ